MITRRRKESFSALSQSIAHLHLAEGGCTVDPVTGQNWAGQRAYAVSPLKSREKVLDHPPTILDIASVIIRNVDLLTREGFVFGSCTSDGRHYMDVCVVTVDLEDSIRLAAEKEQECVWDLQLRRNIWVRSKGGTLLLKPVFGGPQPEGQVSPSMVFSGRAS